MNLLCLSISHHTAPVDVRERLWLSPEEIVKTLPETLRLGCSEAVLFSTCNRTELYAVTDGRLPHESLIRELIKQKNAGSVVHESHFSVYRGPEAAGHLFRVASGIESMVLGDVQILMQVKEGYQLAVNAGTAGFFLHHLFPSAFHTGKRSRTETTIGTGAVSVGYAAVELAERIFENLRKKTALVIGAGETAKLTAKHLRGKNIGSLTITNRTQNRADQLARVLECSTIPFDRFRESLADADIVIASVRVDTHILTADDVARALEHRHTGALFLVDIGVPRNIDPAAGKLENVFLYDIDTLTAMVDENVHKRRAQIPAVERIVADELHSLELWHASLQSTPTIQALTAMMETIRKGEVEKNINRFGEKDRELVELVTKRIVNKILHTPIAYMRNGHDAGPTERLHSVNVIRRIFGLDHDNAKRDDDA